MSTFLEGDRSSGPSAVEDGAQLRAKLQDRHEGVVRSHQMECQEPKQPTKAQMAPPSPSWTFIEVVKRTPPGPKTTYGISGLIFSGHSETSSWIKATMLAVRLAIGPCTNMLNP